MDETVDVAKLEERLGRCADIVERFVYHTLLPYLGEDPDRAGLHGTPERFVGALKELTRGYEQNPGDILHTTKGGATGFCVDDYCGASENVYNGIVIARNIPFQSICEHHMLPFFGRAHVGYIPGKQMFGLSKLMRLVDCFSRRLQIQERLTDSIARTIHESPTEPEGVMVVLVATHLCTVMRGVQKQGNEAITSSVFGVFRDEPAARAEFLHFIDAPGQWS